MLATRRRRRRTGRDCVRFNRRRVPAVRSSMREHRSLPCAPPVTPIGKRTTFRRVNDQHAIRRERFRFSYTRNSKSIRFSCARGCNNVCPRSKEERQGNVRQPVSRLFIFYFPSFSLIFSQYHYRYRPRACTTSSVAFPESLTDERT